jgi:CheY-like chemotaxis protein
LIVDDNVDSAELILFILERHGHEARMVHEARDALELAREFLPDVAVLDIELPEISGYDLALQLRQIEGLGACRLVALTGHAYDVNRRQSEAAGFYRHLTKPFDQEALLEAVSGDEARASCAPAKGWT